jgi:cation transport regulator ChaB
LAEELYRQGYRSILSGLGFIDMLEIAPSRQESRLNPKAFISEVNEGVDGFKAILLEAIYLIEERNKNSHKKLFSDKGKIIIVNSPLRINVENLLSDLRSGFDRGVASIQSYQEILGLDPTTEKERRDKEAENGDEDRFYPHVINNQEEKGKDTFIPSKPRKETDEKNEDQNKKKNTPESKNKTASLEEDLEIAPYDNLNELPKYIKKMTKQCQEVFMATFNSVYEKTGDEGKSFAIANSAARRCMKKQGYNYDKETKTWKK